MRPVTYCTNIHRGENWAEVFAAVQAHAPQIKAALCPDHPFPLGLRLSAQAAEELALGSGAAEFGRWLAEQGLSVGTVNGFPYGPFHGRPVKEQVYLPDWRAPERLAYTLRLAELLCHWLPAGGSGSISTVPVCFGRELSAQDFALARQHLCAALEHLALLREERGLCIKLALEPEPGCYLETTQDLVTFWERLDLPPRLGAQLACCYDCCHQALQFEDPGESLALLAAHGICVAHVQVSSALHLPGGDLARLRRFAEPVYLHQAVADTPRGLLRYPDLPQALDAAPEGVRAWRVHFHLPVFLQVLPECETTRGFLERILPMFAPETPLEVETYTWEVLPPELRTDTVTASIIRELRWVEAARRAPLPRT